MIGFRLSESEVMKNTGGAIAWKVAAIRFWHVISGVGDFSKTGGRYRQVLRGLKRGRETARKSPFSYEMLLLSHDVFLKQGLGNPPRIELFSAAILGFFFLLREGELGKLRTSDIRLGKDAQGEDHVATTIRNSKTDQLNEGDFKTLKSIDGVLCPVKAVARLMTSKQWPCQSEDKGFGHWVRNRLSEMSRLAGASVGVQAPRIGNHSLRSGGAADMWRPGYEVEITKRWGRWKSASFQG